MHNYDSLETVPDETLCRRCAGGDAAAEEALVLRYGELVRRCCRPLFLMGGDSEDLMQEGMLALVLAIRSYRADKGAVFATYARRCIRNRLLNAVRCASSVRHEALNSALSLEAAAELDDGHQGPEQQLIQSDTMAELRSALTALEGQVLDAYLLGLSYEQIALRLGRSVKSVDNAVQRIRKKWASALAG